MASPSTRLAILGGTGPQGRGLALRLARAGFEVVIGSRDAARAQETAAKLSAESGLAIRGDGNAASAGGAALVFVAVPWTAHATTLSSIADELAGRVVVDLVNPLTFDEAGPVGLAVAEGSAAEQAQALLPGCTVVSGFHHVSAKLLLDESRSLDTDILVCGDDAAAKHRVLDIAGLLPGVRPIDAGPLRLSRFLEGMTAVLLSINHEYRTTAGVHLTGVDPARARTNQ